MTLHRAKLVTDGNCCEDLSGRTVTLLFPARAEGPPNVFANDDVDEGFMEKALPKGVASMGRTMMCSVDPAPSGADVPSEGGTGAACGGAGWRGG